ncbi:flagellar export chaperone FliS [Echinimonas agarilytica]|uniref:Flagellar secretion chaperone FliS n=1 Tax=Echinimonas agarilytica TaxID=1215918 RepID=A0AA41W592_9GAMM|nr:flagellar export chaperone FliS [Echinimonas agarilytica]MCM2678959.1 flagellar export chaperone FliS [Echinimonas agarilytica]
MARHSIQQYRKNTVASLKEASPHAQVTAIFQHILGNLVAASNAIERKDIKQKGESISKAIRLLDVLKVSLDLDKGGTIASNLDVLYDYCTQKLIIANIQSEQAPIDEIAGIVRELKEGWDGIPDEYKNGQVPGTPSAE